MTPKLSVVMSVYNNERYLREAVECILAQTFTDFEFIIINDGSTDSTATILESFGDNRLRIIHQENKGLTKALNRGLSVASGEYIARHDGDDTCLPARFAKQVEYLDKHTDVAIVGTSITLIDEKGETVGSNRFSTDSEQIAIRHRETNQLSHGAIMARRCAIQDVGGYREAFRYAQDYDLTLRMIGKYKLANLPEQLCGHRLNLDMLSMRHLGLQRAFASLARELYDQRKKSGIDDLERGLDIEEILPPVAPVDKMEFQRQIVYLCLRSGNMQKARKAIYQIIRHNPFEARSYLHLALSFFGFVTTKALAWRSKA